MALRLLALPFLFSAVPALATDGVIEINQAKVIASGGFPFAINQAGSYRLTSDLDVRVLGLPASTNTNGIAINGSFNVSIDLNGFAILGPADCSGTCTNQGSGNGIAVLSGISNLSIRNGSIIGAGHHGLSLANAYANIEGLFLTHNAAGGISMSSGVVSRTVAADNGGVGIDAYDAVVKDCLLSHNDVYQIRIVFGTIENCTAEAPGAPIKIFSGILRGTSIKTKAGIALECQSACALTANKFSECNGAACITGGGTVMEVPAASNMCGAEDCIP